MKISIVTPSFNSARFIRETILSVITQSGDFSIQYIIHDNCSSDDTIKLVREFQKLLENDNFPIACKAVDLILISEPDRGMYDAINKGFNRANGDVMAWINADDIYLPGAFSTVSRVFTEFDDVHWIKGISSYMTESSLIWKTGLCHLYSQEWIRSGIYGRDDYFIQQDSVFWRAWLWKKAGTIPANIKVAGDYLLWLKYAELTKLVSVQSLFSCFRIVDGQLSQNYDNYHQELITLSHGKDPTSKKAALFRKYFGRTVKPIRMFFFRLFFGHLIFTAIKINKTGNLQIFSGEYFDIQRNL